MTEIGVRSSKVLKNLRFTKVLLFQFRHRWTVVSNIKSVPFGHKWTISAPGITINNPVATLMRTSINLGLNKSIIPGLLIVLCNSWWTYSPLVPKRDTFMLLTVHLDMNFYWKFCFVVWVEFPTPLSIYSLHIYSKYTRNILKIVVYKVVYECVAFPGQCTHILP